MYQCLPVSVVTTCRVQMLGCKTRMAVDKERTQMLSSSNGSRDGGWEERWTRGGMVVEWRKQRRASLLLLARQGHRA